MDLSAERIEGKILRIEQALFRLAAQEKECTLCPRECRANRTAGEKGFCGGGIHAYVSHALLHYGEEPVLSGCRKGPSQPGKGKRAGSGTVFFTGCNLKCLFCQNYQLSWLNQGNETDTRNLAQILLELQDKGAMNINLVSPMHLILPILAGLKAAYENGLNLPLVYNSNAYEKVSTLKHLEGIVDIYLPDLKYRSRRLAEKFCQAPDYFEQAVQAIKEMQRQQPFLDLDSHEAARSGLIVRHLVLPGNSDDSLSILDWMAENISSLAGLSLMSQYVPCFRAPEEIQKKLTAREYERVTSRAQELDFEYLFIQPDLFETSEHLTPDFRRKEPFKWG